jgi:hypothetical protein
MFHKVTLAVYGFLGAILGHWVVPSKETNGLAVLGYTMMGASIAVGLYFLLRFLNFAERAYRREMVAAPQIFKAGKEEDIQRPTFTNK